MKSHTILSRRIRVLDPAVAERIAAGEVIERPASVVKELVENSLDAGASEISVLLEEGGKTLIEVTDNGHGMTASDLPVCVQRHATSKLESLGDLERILTLGFRGEALPSVGAVADVEILSRARSEEGEPAGAYAFTIQSMIPDAAAREVTFGHFLSSLHGTRIQARGLFSQVPARLKFLKSQGAEVSQVREWIERLALAHSEVGFRLISDGRALLTLRPQEESARVRTILSDSGDYPMVTSVSSRESAIQLRAHWLQGMSSPQTRRVVQVVNGRAIRDRMLQQAILTAFKQVLLPGQFPSIAVYIDIPPAEIDVNVHPSKTEVRFFESRRVFQSVEKLISEMIEKNGAPRFVQSFVPKFDPSVSPGPEPTSGSSAALTQFSWPRAGWQAQDSFRPPEQSALQFNSKTLLPPATASPQAQGVGLSRDRYMGAAFNTYLFYDLGTELALIDQHAAHERVRYESLRKNALSAARGLQSAPSQSLLIPEAVRFSNEERPKAEERLPWLLSLGFEAEIFGEDTVLFRAIPADWGSEDLRIRLKNLVERLLAIENQDEPGQTSLSQILTDERLFEKLASEACHSAIRAGDRLEPMEALQLIDRLFECEHPWNCPHGRPTLVRVPKGKIEEWFQRRI